MLESKPRFALKSMLNIKPENRFWIGIYGFTAFILLVAVSVFAWLAWTSYQEPGVGHVAGAQPVRPSAAISDQDYQSMAAFEAPPYAGEARAPKQFQVAMRLYSTHDYKDAMPLLQAVETSHPGLVAARFYLGICLLLTGNDISGIEELRAAIAAGSSPYEDQARFYLAKGLLAEHDVSRARAELEAISLRAGNLRTEAAALLTQIKSSEGS
jgi:hypothetical protein